MRVLVAGATGLIGKCFVRRRPTDRALDVDRPLGVGRGTKIQVDYC
jgi:hypothetical protein